MENSHEVKISHLESTLRVHDKVSSDVVEHDRVLLAPLLKFTPNYTERLYVYHSVSEIHTNLIFKIQWVLVTTNSVTTSNRLRANDLLSGWYHLATTVLESSVARGTQLLQAHSCASNSSL